jgi:hypothetical protein
MPSNVPPDTVGVELRRGGIAVEYCDGRKTFYAGVPQPTEHVRAAPGTEVHLLVTDEPPTRGVLLYVDDRRTPDEVLRESGVGRVLLDDGEDRTPIPGIRVSRDHHAHEIEGDPDRIEGRAFVFVENEREERRYELGRSGSATPSGTEDDRRAAE